MVLSVTLVAFLVVWFLFVFYAAVMNLYRAYTAGKMSKPLKAMAIPVLAVGALLDVAANLFIFTFVLLELPKEWLVTARLSRHKKKTGWRSKVAAWICEHLLDALDPSGCHCK